MTEADGAARNGLALVAEHLACPVCRSPLALEDRVVRCGAGHTFDVARQGYVSLLAGGRRTVTGDDAAMVQAREAFLSRGHYATVARAVAKILPAGTAGLCVDLAGGTGYYLAAVADAHPGLVGLAVDLSTAALRRAARAHGRVAAVGADVRQPLPLRDGAADVVLSIFGPRNVPEIGRILAPRGTLVVVTPHAAAPGGARPDARPGDGGARQGRPPRAAARRLRRCAHRRRRVHGAAVPRRRGRRRRDGTERPSRRPGDAPARRRGPARTRRRHGLCHRHRLPAGGRRGLSDVSLCTGAAGVGADA
ncbi:putative RNA methyltransferase [Georgenia sp. SUBG003]|uniref:putative RNA methyltransferase n=1 Tax=Georgenia sp. SUBG003 TaxID=1497974 RepID=UPI000A4EF82B